MSEKKEEVCIVCAQDADDELVVLCDGKNCNKPYHTYCMKGCLCCKKKPSNFGRDIPEVPEGDWFCKHCRDHLPPFTGSGEGTVVYAWGCNEGGQLGIGVEGKNTNKNSPVLIEDLKGVGILDIKVGGWNSMVLTSENKIYTCGDGTRGKTGHNDVVHEALVKFRLVTALLPENVSAGEGDITKIAMGRDFSAAVSHEGHLYTWGSGETGRLGHQSHQDKKVPTKLSAFRENEIAISERIGCGWNHSICIGSEYNEAFTWGANENGQLGIGSLDISQWVPQNLNPLETRDTYKTSLNRKVEGTLPRNVKDVTCGKNHTVALTDDGKVYTFGAASMGQLGHPPIKPPANYDPNNKSNQPPPHILYRPLNYPKVIADLASSSSVFITQVIVGMDHTFAINSDGLVYGWGSNRFGQLAVDLNKDDKDTKDEKEKEKLASTTPTPNHYAPTALTWINSLILTHGQTLTQLASGDNTTYLLTSSGQVWSWGQGQNGQLGRGEFKQIGLPAKIPSIPPATKIFAGLAEHVFLLIRQDESKVKSKSKSSKSSTTSSTASSSPKTKTKTKTKTKKASNKKTKSKKRKNSEDEDDEEEEETEDEDDKPKKKKKPAAKKKTAAKKKPTKKKKKKTDEEE